MYILNMRRSSLNRNHYFVFGLLTGLILSFYIPQDIWELVQEEECPQEVAEQSLIEKFGHDFEPHLNIIDKPQQAKKPAYHFDRSDVASPGVFKFFKKASDEEREHATRIMEYVNKRGGKILLGRIKEPLNCYSSLKEAFLVALEMEKTVNAVKNVIRPRYYSSELGIREKIFIGVMTSQDNINTLATAINRTSAHLVNKMKFFINADNVKTNYKLKNIVGFTDMRENLRPFHVIKYIADNYLDDYDYFLLIPDTVYVDGRKLKTMLYHLSISFDIYMGSIYTPSDESTNQREPRQANKVDGDAFDLNNDDFRMLSDRNYCDLNAGIILSSSVIRKMHNNLDWCVRNGITNIHSVNIGRCVKYSSKIAGCQQMFQGVQHQTFQLNPYIKLYKDLYLLSKNETFKKATTVYPLTNTDDLYRLHAFYSKYHLELIHQKTVELEDKAHRISNGTIPNSILEVRWPLGVPPASIPDTRHDIIIWHLINRTHMFLPNAESAVEPLRRIDSEDFEYILNVTLNYASRKYPSLQYLEIHSAYRRFDPTRGMDYQIHLDFRNPGSFTTAIVTKSFHIVKPLGRVEVIPSPYVTESTRIAILIPTFEHQVHDALDFINQYESICMKNQDNTFLLMIFIYRYDSPSKGDEDPFKAIKTIALDLSTKYKTDGSRIAWVSIRLPAMYSDKNLPEDIMLTSLYGQHEELSLAVADLALPKIGLDSLVLMGSTSISFKPDFLNRVRMNTIQGFQIFSPIGFHMYPCKLVNFCKECESCDVSQATGYFDKVNYDIISFYSRDYVQARKLVESSLPILRVDADIEKLPSRPNKEIKNILDMFVVSQLPIHALRGVEPNLRFGRAIKNYLEANNNQVPQCPQDSQPSPLPLDEEQMKSINKDIDHSRSSPSKSRPSSTDSDSHRNSKCIHLASRKQIGDAIIRYEDRSILIK